MREYPKEYFWFEGERLLLRRLVNRKQRLMATKIDKTTITNKNLYVIKAKGKESIYYILGIINSKLISKIYLAQVSQATKDDFPQVTINDVLALPYRKMTSPIPPNAARHDRMLALVGRMLELHQLLAGATLPQDRERRRRQIEAGDREIDALVYELYGLTGEEIRLVEEKQA